MDVEGGVFLSGRIEVFSQSLFSVRLEEFSTVSCPPYYVILKLILAVV